jgi:hypothetical protein
MIYGEVMKHDTHHEKIRQNREVFAIQTNTKYDEKGMIFKWYALDYETIKLHIKITTDDYL